MKDPLKKLVAELISTGQLEAIGEPGSPRARIAEAALVLFAEQSYEATTTKSIADRAATTERTLFKHFKSKDELFAQTVFPAFFKALIPVIMEPAMAQLRPGDFRATLRTLLIDRITVAVEHPVLFVMVWRELLMRPAFRSAFEAVFVQRALPVAKAFFANARRRGELRNLSPDLVLRTIMGHLVAYLVTRLVLSPQQRWDTEADADQILELVMRGIAP